MCSNVMLSGSVASLVNYYIDIVVKGPLKSRYTYSYPQMLDVGVRVLVSFGQRNVMGIVLAVHRQKPDFEVKPIIKVLDEQPLLNAELIDLAERIADYNFCAVSEVLFAMIPFKAKRTFIKTTFEDEEAYHSFALTAAQQVAAQQLQANEKIFYLYGVTGSGKTAVLMEVMEKVVATGQDVIYLTPEISLANQLFKTIQQRFPQALLIHSAITDKQRLSTWRTIQQEAGQVVVGTRTAIFSPTKNLGLIIIDEEHDSSYKSSETPRFHARQVAMMRRQLTGCKLIMASATPSLESYYAMQQGLFIKVALTTRPSGSLLPVFKVVDMRHEKSILSRALVSEVLKSKAMGKQSILFLNRKGFARYYSCPDCGFTLLCPHCSVALTYHKKDDKLLCHYCAYQEAPPAACPQCQSNNAGYSTFGLEKVMEEVQRLFSHLRIEQLDGDLIKNKEEVDNILGRFDSGEADLLLATQVVAKGFNFKHLRLVAMVLADIGLGLPDFRAEEKSFDLLMQMAGRTGRYNDESLVIVQTYHPQHQAITAVATADVEGFYQHELAMRRVSGFPPFSRLIKIAFRSKNEEKASQAAVNFAADMHHLLTNDEVLGPAPSPIQKIAGVYRMQVLIRTHQYNRLKEQLHHYFAAHPVIAPVYREVDSDPVSLL